ncbi:MAG TPA: hypothetical protein PLN19_08115 [Methanothrix sp.]|jgi:hypothetical protein|nr:hypothetical protein [Methanothrix sp.]HQE88219.1 hypothetical protein [Methanothrix sp.]HQI68804.1 hypothetical protein [Methanothrix sp.]HRS85760.1 hypothetical protein [Methanothrix sp.]HRT17925.1 hypothetical protein [Methanothrix sp.]
MKGPYEFLQQLHRLMEAYARQERIIWAMNAAILSTAAYALAEIVGLPAFTDFYYQDIFIIAKLPAIICILAGLAGATLIKRRKKTDFFPLLGPQISEMARTAYDNQELDTLPMQKLAADLKVILAGIRPSQILDSRRIKFRAAAMAALLLAAIFLAQSESAVPTDFQSLADLREKALSAFEEQKPEEKDAQPRNLSGNLFGNPSLAVLDENKIELVLDPGTGAGSLPRNVKPVERVFTKSQAGKAAAVPSELYIESLPPENREIIKRYFTILPESI